MPDFDTGHIFLTTLAPIKRPQHASDSTLYLREIRAKLAAMQPARQSPATYMVPAPASANETWRNSPFSRNDRTHLARFFVLEDVVYNGRPGGSALSASLSSANPSLPLGEDRLNCAYLVFCADIDAVISSGEALPNALSDDQQKEVRNEYAKLLWETMGEDLLELYSNCYGFDMDRNSSSDKFAEYLEKCHIETTMPFHDYFATPSDSQLFSSLPSLSLGRIIKAGVAFIMLALVLLALLLFGVVNLTLWLSVPIFLLLSFIVAGLTIVGATKYLLKRGEQPWPHGEFDDLPSVLKALYIQQKFLQFVVENQNVTKEQLYNNFDEFDDCHRPLNKFSPTQSPGVISSSVEDGVVSVAVNR